MGTPRTKRTPTTVGKPRKVNQVLLNRMVALRKQGFSCREIAQQVQRSERTVRRYTRGVHREVAVVVTATRVDVLTACGKIILWGRERLKLTTQEVDFVFKHLRKTFESKDPLTRAWLATDATARTDFLLRDVLPTAMSEIRVRRWMQQIREMVGSGEAAEVESPEVAPRPPRALPP